MEHYAGIDVSKESSSVCVVDATGKVIAEAKVASEPAALVSWLRERPETLKGIGLEAGPLSQWLFAALEAAGLPASVGLPQAGFGASTCRAIAQMNPVISRAIAGTTITFGLPAATSLRVARAKSHSGLPGEVP